MCSKCSFQSSLILKNQHRYFYTVSNWYENITNTSLLKTESVSLEFILLTLAIREYNYVIYSYFHIK